ncbi:MAG: YwpF family protein [Bacillus sp. (in: firmicutes)]
MKSFKLVSLRIYASNDQLVDVKLSEGLVINMEDDKSRWLLEGFVHADDYGAIEPYLKQPMNMKLQAVISKPDNNPAAFQATLKTIKKVEDFYSILFEGTIIYTQIGYSERLLQHLLDEGLKGEELLAAYKEKIRTRPALPVPK